MKKMRTRINSGSPVPFTLFVLHCSLLFSKDLKLTPSAYCKDRVLSFVMHLRSDCLLKMAVHKTAIDPVILSDSLHSETVHFFSPDA